jgi:peptidoglycan-N-acetylglucosamine deacetylase
MTILAPLSLDLDDKWSYLKTHGKSAWRDLPTYLPVVVPRILSMLRAQELQITFFIVGQDAARPMHRDSLVDIASSGHEIGNHSFSHEPWLERYNPSEVHAELERAHAAITEATGREPKGFRGPGFSFSSTVLEELGRLGYSYDATVFASILNPVGRAYYFLRSDLTREEREERKELFGTFRGALRPNLPFDWVVGDGRLHEVPVTTMPGFRIPFHFSYLLFIAQKSKALAMAYFRSGLWLCEKRAVAPSLLLHPLDFLGAEDAPELSFFPGMKIPRQQKLEWTAEFLGELARKYELSPILNYVNRVFAQPVRHLPVSAV